MLFYLYLFSAPQLRASESSAMTVRILGSTVRILRYLPSVWIVAQQFVKCYKLKKFISVCFLFLKMFAKICFGGGGLMGASLVAQLVKNLLAMQETPVWFLGQEDPLEEGMAIHSCVLTWRIPMDRGTWRATGHNWATKQSPAQRLMGRIRNKICNNAKHICRDNGRNTVAQISPRSLQFSSVAQLCPTLCNPMNRSTPGLPVHHQLPESTQIHAHWVSDAIQPSHPLSSPSPALNLSQHQGLFKWVSS